mmetsp:Transcript_92199/g.298219  ORF Transcript_92199/g.298219 Transcript_92199/m.298219 type:complete len:209 (+) Transcript_92199:2-628(+)
MHAPQATKSRSPEPADSGRSRLSDVGAPRIRIEAEARPHSAACPGGGAESSLVQPSCQHPNLRHELGDILRLHQSARAEPSLQLAELRVHQASHQVVRNRTERQPPPTNWRGSRPRARRLRLLFVRRRHRRHRGGRLEGRPRSSGGSLPRLQRILKGTAAELRRPLRQRRGSCGERVALPRRGRAAATQAVLADRSDAVRQPGTVRVI